MKINKQQTALNIAENYEEHGGAKDELAWLLLEGHKGFNHMTTEEIEKYTEENCGLSKDSFPEIIVYDKESQ
jgi:hypothetical protein